MKLDTQDNPNKNGPLSVKNSEQNNFSLIATHPLYLTASKDLELQTGVSYKTLNNYGLINSVRAEKLEHSKYWSTNLGLEYLFQDNFNGYNIIQSKFIQGMNGNFSNYQDPTDTAAKHFNLIKLDLYRQQLLSNNFSVFAHFAVNFSDKKLPDQELFVLGGREFGRGYSFCTIDGNKMVALSLEARYSKDLDHKVIEQIEPYIFIDSGYVGKQDSNTNITNLSSSGAGLRFKLLNNIDLSAEVAQAFTHSYIVDGTKETAGTRLNIFVNKIFKF